MMKEYISKDYVLTTLASSHYPWSAFEDSYEIVQNTPTADVVPTTELIELLRSLKRELHEKATYPPMVGVNSFVPLKLFDAVLQTYMNKYMEGNYEANRK